MVLETSTTLTQRQQFFLDGAKDLVLNHAPFPNKAQTLLIILFTGIIDEDLERCKWAMDHGADANLQLQTWSVTVMKTVGWDVTELETLAVANRIANDFELTFVKPFYNNENYISAVSNTIKPHLESDSYDKIVFSYHGIPRRQAKKTDETGEHCFSTNSCCEVENDGSKDCYRSHTRIASSLTAEKLGLKEDQWEVAYQSRLGPGWLTPFTDKRLAELPTEGKDNIAILCPSFISDCLETLEEIDIRGRETFFNAGGKKMTYIPCLNDSEETIKLLEELVRSS